MIPSTVVTRLRAVVGSDSVLSAHSDLLVYECDGFVIEKNSPDVVVFPIRDLNPNLNLWTVVYTHEFENVEFWTAMRPHMDVITLWIWKSEDILHMPDYVEQCRKLFPDKPIVMGVYLRDYTKVAPIPVDQVKRQMEGIADQVGSPSLSPSSRSEPRTTVQAVSEPKIISVARSWSEISAIRVAQPMKVNSP